MLQDYHRQTTIKPFAPKLKDQSSKRWNDDVSMQTNLSLLSISDSSKSSQDEDEIDVNQYSRDRDLSSSRESISPLLEESEEPKSKHVDLDPYIFNKHLKGITSTMNNLVESDFDKSVNELFEGSSSSFRWQNDDYNARLIRPPPFSQYMKTLRESRTKIKPIDRRSARIPVRTTKAEQLKLARQQSANENKPNLPHVRPSTTIPQYTSSFNSSVRHPTIPSTNRITRTRATSNCSFRQSESARSCKVALGSNGPLLLSSILVKQMRQDIQSNRVPAYSKPLNSALLREQPHSPLSYQYKMKRIHHWLEKLIPRNYIEYNEYASNESTIGTKFNDKLDDDYDLLADEKRAKNIERTYDEAHRALPLFKSEIERKMRHHNLLLTRLELDLYVL